MFTIDYQVCFKTRCWLDFHMEYIYSFDEENKKEVFIVLCDWNPTV